CLTQTLQSHLVLGEVDAVGSLELLYQPVNDALIPVVAAQRVITSSCHNFNNTVADFQKGNVEGTAAKVEDQDGLFLVALFQAISKCSRGWLVNNTQDVQACNLASFLRCLTLRVLEVCRNGNNCVSNILTEVSFRVALELHQGTCGNLLRSVLLIINIHAPVGADVALNGADGAINVCNSLVLCRLANKNFTILGKSYNRWRGACALRVSNNGSLATFQHRYNRVGSTKVNTYCASHSFNLLLAWVFI